MMSNFANLEIGRSDLPKNEVARELFGQIYQSSSQACFSNPPSGFNSSYPYGNELWKDGYEFDGFHLSTEYGGGGYSSEDWADCMADCEGSLKLMDVNGTIHEAKREGLCGA